MRKSQALRVRRPPGPPIAESASVVLRPLLEDRGRITESICILVTVDRMEEKCFQITTKRVRRSQQLSVLPSRNAATL